MADAYGGDVDPKVIASLLQSGQNQYKGEADRYRKMAQMMRQQGQGLMQMQDAGRYKVAPGWGNLAGNLLSQYMGMRQDDKAGVWDRALDRLQTTQAGDAYEALRRKQQAQQQQPQQPQQPFMGGGGIPAPF